MSRQNNTPGKGWKKVLRHDVVEGHRKGWKGLWDHFVSLVRKDSLHFIQCPVTFSFYVQSEKQVVVRIAQARMEFDSEETVCL